MLSRVRIVLINTSHPGNIGAVARAMKNMCLEQLVLVDPKSFPHADATSRASGADDLLGNARVVDTLEEALQNCGLVIGASARMRRLAWPQLDPRQCADMVLTETSGQDIAIIFGRENAGLTNDELARCNYLVHIPANPEYTSLNIATAVQVIVYELFTTSLARQEPGEESGEIILEKREQDAEFASADEMEGFFQQLEQTLIDIEFLTPHHQKQKMLRRLRRLYNRARINKVEINILRGILSTMQHKVRR